MEFFDDIINDQYNPNIKNNAIALRSKEREVCFYQLNNEVNKVARYLSKFKINIGEKIMLLMNKSIDFVIIELAILKIGAVFIPIDTSQPMMRIIDIIQKSKPVLAITEDESVINIDVKTIKKFELLTEETTQGNEMDFADIRKKRQSSDLAYIIFTSGSTGTPKGVMIKHEGIVSFIKSASSVLKYGSDMKMLSLAPMYFDTSIHEIYCTLYVGGKVYFKDKFTFIQEVYGAIFKNEITDLVIVSTVLKLITQGISDKNVNKLASLKRVIFCGESCAIKTLSDFSEKCGQVQLIQGYGPTETSVGCMFKYISNFEVSKFGFLPLGNLIEGVSGVILDDNKNVVSKGNVGTLYLSGVQVMKGYCGDEELSKSVFIHKHELSDDIWYRTNDLMYLNENNEYSFAGRNDDMVKINGKLVYINEIANRLNKIDAIEEYYILPYQDAFDITRLAAFIIPYDGIDISPDSIYNSLKIELPDYMIPVKIRIITKGDLCRTNTDKVDKKRLLELF